MAVTEFEAIRARLSVRNYSTKKIPEELRAELSAWFDTLEPFDPAARVTMAWETPETMFLNAKGVNVQAPYYLVFRAEKSKYSRESVGYLGEQMALHLVTLGIGSCWLGGARAKNQLKENYVIAMAVGYPREDIAFRTQESQFKRKPAEAYCASVVEGNLFADALDAARLAPSGMNWQPVRYEAVTDHMHVLRKAPLVPFGIEPMQRVDAGIGLAHVVLSLRHAGKKVRIGALPAPSAARFQYVISVTLEPEGGENTQPGGKDASE